jgi:uncharacterized protein (DUF1015 family)
MAEIQPFHGVLYNTDRVNPADVLTQPYDKITAEMRERYLAASPHNLIRIELGKEDPGDTATANKYTRASDLYRSWLHDGILHRSDRPALYWLEQTFDSPAGSDPRTRGSASLRPEGHASAWPSGLLTRRALIARVRLHRWDEGIILPHEQTLSKPKADRLSLLRAVGAQQGQIFMLHPDPLPTSALQHLGTPLYELVDDYRVTNRLWEITDPSTIQSIQSSILPQCLYIADGHHRYETALAYRDEAGTEASKFVMATIVDMNDPGLVILPTHRTVANLTGFDPRKFREKLAGGFHIEPVEQASRLFARTETGGTPVQLGMADSTGFALLRPKDPAALKPLFAGKPPLWDTLDVAILHVAILEALLGIDEQKLREEANVTYWREPEKALEQVRTGKAQLAFFLNSTPVAAVKAIADARSRMPQKSTDFYPKLLSGMVMYEVR